jgi:glyceraldehyde-3-phosphate dehydrogenase (NAD(P))
MNASTKLRVALNGYGVIGKRVAAAVALQDDMELTGVSDVGTDWRLRVAGQKGFRLFGAAPEHAEAMRQAGLEVEGTLDDLLGRVDVVVDCTPKRVAARNVELYRHRERKFILQGGEKHEVAGHSFVAKRATRAPSAGSRRGSSPATRPPSSARSPR